MELSIYLITLFLLAVGVIAILVVTEGGRQHKTNMKLTAEDHVLQGLLALREGLLSLPEADRAEVLRNFRLTLQAFLRLNGLSRTLSHLTSHPNKPLLVLAAGNGKAASRN